MNHSIFGLGMYATAIAMARTWPAAA